MQIKERLVDMATVVGGLPGLLMIEAAREIERLHMSTWTLARLREDVDRYRWLLKNSFYGISKHQCVELYFDGRLRAPDHIWGLSAAIDEAMISDREGA